MNEATSPVANPLRVRPRRLRLPWGALQFLLLLMTACTLTLSGIWWRSSLIVTPGAFLEQPLLVLSEGLPYALCTLAILGSHELGHYLACRYYRLDASLPWFLPGLPPIGTLGAVIRIRQVIPTRRALFDIAAAGPIAGFLVALPIATYGLWFGEKIPDFNEEIRVFGRPLLFHLLDYLRFGESLPQVANSYYGAAWIGMIVTSLNLFPVGQLDGGHVVYSLSPRMHRWSSWATIIALVGLCIFHLLRGFMPGYVLWLVILLWMRSRHPRLSHDRTPLGSGRVAIAVLLLVMFALCFLPLPMYFRL